MEKYGESQVLQMAWERFAELDANADHSGDQHKRMGATVITLGVFATIVAVLIESFGDAVTPLVFEIMRVVLILIPIVGSTTLAFANKFQLGDKWLALRSGAEEVRKEIYLYRTVLQGNSERESWLSARLADIQRHVHETVSGDLVLKPYKGKLPSTYDPKDENSDPGYINLLPNDYIRFRLENQLNWHRKKVQQVDRNRTTFQVAVFVFSGIGVLLASLGREYFQLMIWVAVTSSLTAAFTAWMELRRMQIVVQNYSKVILELGIIRDHWFSMSGEHRTGDQFFKMVVATEQVLWTQHNKYISEMRQAVAQLGGEGRDLVVAALNAPVPDTLEEALELENLAEDERRAIAEAERAAEAETTEVEKVDAEILATISTTNAAAVAAAEEKIKQIREAAQAKVRNLDYREKASRPHAFAIMPFGRKKGFDGQWIDFNAIYQDMIKPALIEAGFEPFRADEETVSGDILTDMFQELLLADMCIIDMSIDNANVFYEVGIRHAFRKRGIVHIQSGRSYMPFDVFNVRTIPYHLDSNGKPDPEELEKDIATIARVTRDTWNSDQDAVHSPVFNLLTGLEEPDRKQLQTRAATGFWREYNEWAERMEIAKRKKQIGDILLLTEEINNPLIKEDAIVEAGRSLRSMGRHRLAIKQYRAGQAVNPKNNIFRREEAFHLNRLGRTDDAIVKLENLLEKDPADSEAISYLGRIYREMWSDSWQQIEDDTRRIEAAFKSSHWLVKAINTYTKGYRIDQNNTYPGINALTWSVVLDSLAAKFDDDQDPDVEHVRSILPNLSGAVQFALEKKTNLENADYWDLVSMAEMMVYSADDPRVVARAYKKALTASKKNSFYLNSSLGQLSVLDSLGFRPDFVQVGRQVLEDELAQIVQPGGPEHDEDGVDIHAADTDELVFLFSGHMIDFPMSAEAIFPPEMEAEAIEKLAEAMDKWEADANDIGVTVGGAAGGDILFIEECLRRNMQVEILLPFEEPKYLRQLVSSISEEWTNRYYDIRNHPHVRIRMQTEVLGPVKKGDDKYMRNNRWAMYSALVRGIDKVRFMALWDGCGDADAGYGTIVGRMVDEVRDMGAIVEHIDTTKFKFFEKAARSKARKAKSKVAAAAETDKKAKKGKSEKDKQEKKK